MQSFDIVNIRVMLAVARLGSIGAAARAEHIAASAASRRISDLEHDLGIILIQRTPSGATLTPAGKVFARHCETILQQFADVRADLKRFAEGQVGELRIAAVTSVIASTLPPRIAAFRAANPAIEISLTEIYSADGVRYLREDLADLIIISDTMDTRGFETRPYQRDPVWVLGPPDHPLFADKQPQTPIAFEEAMQYELLSLHEGGALDDLIATAGRRAGKTLKRSIKVVRLDSLRRCAEAGLGLGFLRESSVRPYLSDRLAGAPLTDAWADRQVVCVYPKAHDAAPVVSHFLDGLSQ